jgi:hypothetical protein
VLVKTVKNLPLKYYGMCESPAQNGTQYDAAIDLAIIDELCNSSRLSSGELKRSIEGILNRFIPRRTYYTHLNMMIHDDLLIRTDNGERGKQSVFYSLTEATKKKHKLMPLRTDQIHRTSYFSIVKEMYAHIFFNNIIKNRNNGISVKVLERKYRNSSYLNQIITAFKLLVENDLLESTNKKNYVLSDPGLGKLLADILEYRKDIKEAESKSERRQIMEEYDMLETKGYPEDRINAINIIKTKHANTLKEYSYLRDVIQMYCPLLFPEIPYRDLMRSI